MIKDILPYFPFCGNNVAYGLFERPINQRTKMMGLSKKYGVNATYYPDAKDIKLSDEITLLDMFHGYCTIYAKFFNDKHPEFETMMLERTNSFWNITNHVFCVKHLDNGICIFADARGLSDNPLEFFADYSFCKNNMNIYPLNIEFQDVLKIDLIDLEICNIAYRKIYKNCPYLEV